MLSNQSTFESHLAILRHGCRLDTLKVHAQFCSVHALGDYLDNCQRLSSALNGDGVNVCAVALCETDTASIRYTEFV